MIGRRTTGAAALALAVSIAGGACGFGGRQAQADRIITAGKKLMAARAIEGSLSVVVKVLPVDRVLVAQEPPRIAAGGVGPVPVFVSPRANTAAVGRNAAGEVDALRFVGASVFERIAPKSITTSGAGLAVPSNLPAIIAASTGEAVERGMHDVTTGVTLTTPSTTSSSTTSTTAAPRLLRRTVQIVRTWAAFDFAAIPKHDKTKHGGSFAINPVALFRLTTGVLTGSIERRGQDRPGLPVRYDANVSRDKAERNLNEDARKVLDKMFTANAVTRRVFPAHFFLDPKTNELVAFEVVLRQQLSSKDRADLTATFNFHRSNTATTVKPPPRRGTVNVSTLNQLVTTVTGA